MPGKTPPESPATEPGVQGQHVTVEAMMGRHLPLGGVGRFFYRFFYRMVRHGALRSVTNRNGLQVKQQVSATVGHRTGSLNMASI
jgi:hypothetical protein